ncbi:MAG: DUF3488 and DUF4129 domain-containing transglutaminase family protein, partial [Anaerolineae bacterium]
GPRQLTAKPVMMVNAPGGRYWRASVYDEYTGFGWRSSDQESVDIARNKQMSALPLFRARHPFTQTYTLFNEGALVLYAMANPVKFDRSGLGKVSVIAPADAKNSPYNYWAGKNRPWLEEITYIESDSRLKANEPYQVVSLVSQATQEQLRRDSGDYPNWITERYLQLPEGIPRRVFGLAEEITAQADTPYDKALAVETYLRKNITYNEGIAPPPRSRDKVDYILFDLKQAYCDYYATSMIVMLRSLGIPARLAAGFARGRPETLDNQERVYFVQNKDAHSWVEVFFPTYGWIEFEPTAAQPAIARYVERTDDFVGGPDPDRNLQEDAFDPLDRVEDIDAGQGEGADSFFTINLPFWGQIQAGKGAVRTIAIGGALLAVAVGGWSLYSRRKESQPDELPQVGSVYMAMLKLAAWMGFKKRAAQTPYEHAGQLGRSVPEIKPEVDLITTEFVRQNFSRAHSTTDVMRAKILAAWSAARPILYRAIFERRNPLRKIRLPFKW